MAEAYLILPETFSAYIAKEDEALNRRAGYTANELDYLIRTLQRNGRIEVGWRECCGKTDFTMHVHRAWCKVVKKIAKAGIVLTEERVKHKNAYATDHGGFWSSTVYTAPGAPVVDQK